MARGRLRRPVRHPQHLGELAQQLWGLLGTAGAEDGAVWTHGDDASTFGSSEPACQRPLLVPHSRVAQLDRVGGEQVEQAL